MNYLCTVARSLVVLKHVGMSVCMYMYVCEYVCNLVLGERLYSVSFFKFLIEVRLESVMEDCAREV